MERNMRIEEELFPFYALDALTEEERREVDEYVAGDPEARLRLAELIAAASDLSATAQPIAPSPGVKAGLMARVEADSQAATAVRAAPTTTRRAAEPPPARRRWWSWVPAVGFAAAVVALLLAGTTILNLNRQIDTLERTVAAQQSALSAMESDLGVLQTQNDELRDQLRAREEQLAVYLAPGAITIALADVTGEHPESVGSLTINPTSGAANLSVANLPPLDETQTYQGWLIVEGTPVSVGTFDVDASGAASHSIEGAQPGSFEAVGVSIEPAGGSEQPTTDQIILLAGFTT